MAKWTTSDLYKEFKKGGRIEITSIAAKNQFDNLNDFIDLLKRFSDINAPFPKCESILLKGLAIDNFDLQGLGTDVSPIMGLKLDGCDLPKGLKLSDAVLNQLTLSNCNFTGDKASIEAARVSVLHGVRIENCLQAPHEIDFEEAHLRKGCSLINVGEDGRLQKITFARAKVEKFLTVCSVTVKAQPGDASFDAPELVVSGSLGFDVPSAESDSHSDFTGRVDLSAAQIGGRLFLKSITINAHKASAREPFPLAIMAEGLKVESDLFLRNSRKSDKPSSINGQIDLVGAIIKGDVQFDGNYDAGERMRSFKCLRINIGGDLRCGYIPHAERRFASKGEMDFTGAKIGGEAIFSGSTHHLNVDCRKFGRRNQGVAVNLRNAVIASDVLFEGSDRAKWNKGEYDVTDKPAPCEVQGISLIGASIGGRLVIRGAKIEANYFESKARKAITANGSSIRGGIEITPDEYKENETDKEQITPRRSLIIGDFRLRNANIGGPVLFRGVDMDASTKGDKVEMDASTKGDKAGVPLKGVALWAANSQFNGDVIFEPFGEKPSTIRGELRFWGATIAGTLYIQGMNLIADKSASALDCYAAEIKKGALVGEFDPVKSGRKPGRVSCTISGLVSFNFARVQSLTFGSDPAAKNDGTVLTQIVGALLMRDMKVQGATIISNVRFTPADLDGYQTDLNLKERVVSRLNVLGIYRKYTIIHGNYACFGTRLFVRLHDKQKLDQAGNPIGKPKDHSVGLINLYGASAGTIGALSGFDPDPTIPNTGKEHKIPENWGPEWLDLQHKGPVGKPRAFDKAKHDVLLNLDEFTYQRLNDRPEDTNQKPNFVTGGARSLGEWLSYFFLGRPTRELLRPRFDWLQRQVENPDSFPPIIVSPYRQIAKSYREMGNLQLSYAYVRERRILQIKHGKMSGLQKGSDRLFSAFFGFGYSPGRASVTVICLYLVGLLFVCWAGNNFVKDLPQEQEVKASVQKFDAPAKGFFSLPLANRCKCISQTVAPLQFTINNPEVLLDGKLVPSKLETKACATGTFNQLAEAYRIIMPFWRFQASDGCHFDDKARSFRIYAFRISLAFLQFLSWIIFPLAAITFSGVLREKQD